MIKLLRLAALVLLFLLAIAFSLKQLVEPDLWWQLRTGEWILQTGDIPRSDAFSFTYPSAPWQNIKWGYELLIAGLSRTLGVEMILMLQVICSCLLVYLLPKLTRTLAPQNTDLQPFVSFGSVQMGTLRQHRVKSMVRSQ
jgi:hypothetical protein